MITELYILLPLTFVAAMLNASVGGGGLVLIPGLFALFPSTLPATLLATEKCASVAGQATASVQYARRIRLPWKLLALASATAFVGAHLGARAIAVLPATLVKPFIVVLLASGDISPELLTGADDPAAMTSLSSGGYRRVAAHPAQSLTTKR